MVMDTLRESLFGQTMRFLTGDRVFLYPEERDPQVWYSYINSVKSSNLAIYGNINPDPVDVTPPSFIPPAQITGSHTHVDEVPLEALEIPRPALPGNESRDSLATQVDPFEQNRKKEKIEINYEKDALLIDFAENDPANPYNWSLGKRSFITGLLCLLTVAIYIGSAIYSPGIPDVMVQFGISQVAATLGLTLFILGYGIGPMLWGPMSEIPQVGFNLLYIPTLLIFVVFQVPTGLSVNLGMLLVFRFLSGFFGSPVLANGGASIAYMFSAQKRAYPIVVWGATAVCGPVLGPVVGGFAAQAKGWKWTIWELSWLSGFTLIVIFFFLPETSHANILYRRTRRLRKLTGRPNLRCESELVNEQNNHLLHDIAISTARGFALNFQEPIVFFLNIYTCLIYGLIYAWFESFAVVFGEIYGFSLPIEGLSFVGILVGVMIAVPPYCAYIYYVQEPKFNEKGELKPEHRLPPAFVGAFLVPISLFLFGWTGRASIPWIVPIIGSSIFIGGAMLLFMAVLNYLGDAYPAYAASVLAGNDFMRSTFGAAFPLFATQMYHKLGVGWASTLLALLAILFIPIPFVLHRYGERIRMASPRARHDL